MNKFYTTPSSFFYNCICKSLKPVYDYETSFPFGPNTKFKDDDFKVYDSKYLFTSLVFPAVIIFFLQYKINTVDKG